MDSLIRLIFSPPALPAIRPMSFIKDVERAFNLAYWSGVNDGLKWGLIVGLYALLFAILIVRKR